MESFSELIKARRSMRKFTEEELTQVDGGAIPLVAWILAHPYLSGTIAGGVTAVGTAIWGAFK